MASAPQSPVRAEPVAFEPDVVARNGERVTITGRWFGVRGRRFVRPTLTAGRDGSGARALADLEHKPWSAEDGEPWTAAFALDADAAGTGEFELAVAPDIAVVLRAPTTEGRVTARTVGGQAAGQHGARQSKARGGRPRGAGGTEMAGSQAKVEAQQVEIAELRRRLDRSEVEAAEVGAAAARRDAAVAKLDAVLEERDAALAERDRALEARDAAFAERDVAMVVRDSALGERDVAMAARDSALAERDAATEARDAAVAKRDAAAAPAPPPGVLDPVAPPEARRPIASTAPSRADRRPRLRVADIPAAESVIGEPEPARSPVRMWATRALALGVLLAVLAALVLVVQSA